MKVFIKFFISFLMISVVSLTMNAVVFKLPPLPYAEDALAPMISKETLFYHYEKHHAAYVNNLNKLIVGTKFEDMKLEDIIKNADGAIYNNAAQDWNHTFYWNSMTPKSEGTPKGALLNAINKSFGSLDKFKEKFTATAMSVFGSGWVWVVKKPDGSVDITVTANAGNPLKTDDKPLLTCDVWEHAYYIDYRNERAKYIENYWKLINWKFASDNFGK